LLYTLASVYFANFSSVLLGMCSGCAILKLTEANCCEKGNFFCNCVQLLGLLFVFFWIPFLVVWFLASVYFANFAKVSLKMCSGCAILMLTEANCCEKEKNVLIVSFWDYYSSFLLVNAIFSVLTQKLTLYCTLNMAGKMLWSWHGLKFLKMEKKKKSTQATSSLSSGLGCCLWWNFSTNDFKQATILVISVIYRSIQACYSPFMGLMLSWSYCMDY